MGGKGRHPGVSIIDIRCYFYAMPSVCFVGGEEKATEMDMRSLISAQRRQEKPRIRIISKIWVRWRCFYF